MGIKHFIEKLQQSDDRRKLRWLIGLTALTGAIVIGGAMLAAPNPQYSRLVRKEDEPNLLDKIAISAEQVTTLLRTKTANTIHFFSKRISKTNTVEVNLDTTQSTTNP